MFTDIYWCILVFFSLSESISYVLNQYTDVFERSDIGGGAEGVSEKEIYKQLWSKSEGKSNQTLKYPSVSA